MLIVCIFFCNILICKYLAQSINLIFFSLSCILIQNEFNFYSIGSVRILYKTNNYDYRRSAEFTKNKTQSANNLDKQILQFYSNSSGSKNKLNCEHTFPHTIHTHTADIWHFRSQPHWQKQRGKNNYIMYKVVLLDDERFTTLH